MPNSKWEKKNDLSFQGNQQNWQVWSKERISLWFLLLPPKHPRNPWRFNTVRSLRKVQKQNKQASTVSNWQKLSLEYLFGKAIPLLYLSLSGNNWREYWEKCLKNLLPETIQTTNLQKQWIDIRDKLSKKTQASHLRSKVELTQQMILHKPHSNTIHYYFLMILFIIFSKSIFKPNIIEKLIFHQWT